jgi:predicted transcriptional regulator
MADEQSRSITSTACGVTLSFSGHLSRSGERTNANVSIHRGLVCPRHLTSGSPDANHIAPGAIVIVAAHKRAFASVNSRTLTNHFGSPTFLLNQGKLPIMTAFTVRVPDEIAEKLDHLAQKMDRSRAYMAAQAIEDFVVREEWQLAEIEAGLAEADRGEFASAAEVALVVGKYVKPAHQS